MLLHKFSQHSSPRSRLVVDVWNPSVTMSCWSGRCVCVFYDLWSVLVVPAFGARTRRGIYDLWPVLVVPASGARTRCGIHVSVVPAFGARTRGVCWAVLVVPAFGARTRSGIYVFRPDPVVPAFGARTRGVCWILGIVVFSFGERTRSSGRHLRDGGRMVAVPP